MAWSAENATEAYLRTLNLGNRGILEPDVAEFISALAAGTGARVMVEVCGGSGAGPTTLALIAAANQTGGHAVCILRSPEELHSSARFLGPDHSRQVDLVLGDAEELLLREYRGADFVLVDCQVYGSERAFKAAQRGAAEAAGGGVVVGYNAMCGGSGDGFNDSSSSSRRGGMKVELLPIGSGLRVCRVPPATASAAAAAAGRRSWWVVRVDEGTGEEHVFRITRQGEMG